MTRRSVSPCPPTGVDFICRNRCLIFIAFLFVAYNLSAFVLKTKRGIILCVLRVAVDICSICAPYQSSGRVCSSSYVSLRVPAGYRLRCIPRRLHTKSYCPPCSFTHFVSLAILISPHHSFLPISVSVSVVSGCSSYVIALHPTPFVLVFSYTSLPPSVSHYDLFCPLLRITAAWSAWSLSFSFEQTPLFPLSSVATVVSS